MRGRADRKKSEKQGRRAETVAMWWLRAKGYRILGSRVRTPRGEIDIIAKKGSVIAFIEVKNRANIDAALAAVRPQQMRRIISAANYWLATANSCENLTCRFDIMLIKPYVYIKHVMSAFDESARPI